MRPAQTQALDPELRLGPVARLSPVVPGPAETGHSPRMRGERGWVRDGNHIPPSPCLGRDRKCHQRPQSAGSPGVARPRRLDGGKTEPEAAGRVGNDPGP